MAVTAKFVADFASFTDAVKKADVQLKDMETGAGKVEKALNRMVDGFSGRKLIQDATLSAEAVDRIGGVTKLTAAELERLGAQAKEAAEKMKAMGIGVPQNLQNIIEASKKVGVGLEGIAGSAVKLAGALGIGFSVGAILSFGKGVFDAATHIGDLSKQLGISTDAVQGFKFAAEQSGSTLDEVGVAITKMNSNLAGGDKATVEALKQAGLNFQAIRNLKPEDAFLAIADAIQKMPDPMEQAHVALKLFGKSAGELLPAMKEGFRGVSNSASKMSEDTIRDLKAAQDAWNELGTKVTVASGTVIAGAMNASENLTSSFSSFVLFADNAIKVGVPAALAMAAAQEQAAKAAGKNRDVNLPLGNAIHKTAEQLAEEAAAAKKAAEALAAMFGKFSGADAAQEMRDLDIVFRRLADSGKITEQQVREIAKRAAELGKEGATLTPRLNAIALATGAVGVALDQNAIPQVKQLGTQIEIVVPVIDKMWEALNKPIPFGISHLKDEFAALVVITPADMLKGVEVKTHDVTKALGELAQSFSQLATISGGSIGSVVRGMGEIVAATDTAAKGWKTFNESLKPGGSSLQGILGIATGIMGIVSAGIAAGNALSPLLSLSHGKLGDLLGTNHTGRDVVESFAAVHGGFDALHRELSILGADGERLWISLTQGVGRANPEAAAAAVKQVTDALSHSPSTNAGAAGYQTIADLQAVATQAQKTYEYMRDSGLYAASAVEDAFKKATDAALAAMDSASSAAYNAAIKARDGAQQALDSINSQIKTLQDAVNAEAPEEVMGLVETQQRAQLANLEEQRAHAQATVDDLNSQIQDAAAAAVAATSAAAQGAGQATVDAIQAALKGADFRVRVHVDPDGLPSGLSIPAPPVPGFATGTQGKYLDFGSGTLAMLHGRERVMTAGEGNGAARDLTIRVPMLINGRQIAEALAQAVLS